jgi:hypothetical protein
LGEEVSAEEWMKCGYVIDLPLSEEGSWLRVAIPDPKTKTFFMDWVFIPYGSFLIRSVALFHSGHYGSLGNTRFHATFSVKNTSVHSNILTYFKKLGEKQPEFAGWKLRWNPNVPEDCRSPDGYSSYHTPRTRNYKIFGTNYFEQVVKPGKTIFSDDILRNLSIYKKIPESTLAEEMKNDGKDVESCSSVSISSEEAREESEGEVCSQCGQAIT